MAQQRSGKIQTIGEALPWIESYLQSHGDEHPRLSAQYILSLATGLSRIELYMQFDRNFTEDERAILREAIRRRGEGEPLQYISGEVAFRRIVLKVEPGVLIPRPETEILVDKAIAFLKDRAQEKPLRVLDLCTGSGCIALSLVHEVPNVTVVATDISQTALSCAKRNAQALNLSDKVEFFEGDLSDAVPQDYCNTFDLIISNPPYIPSEELKTLPQEVVGFEPTLALDGGEDGLDLYRKILEQAPRLLQPDGMLACELFEESLEDAQTLAQSIFKNTKIVQDLNRCNRVICASCLKVSV